MKAIIFYISVIAGVVVMLFISSTFFRGSRSAAIGIAQSKDHKITTERPVLIAKIFVRPGQEVKANEKLIELESQELDAQIEKLKYRIQVLTNEQLEKQKLARAQVNYIKAEEKLEDETLLTQIAALENEIQVNKKLYTGFSDKADSVERWPQMIKLKALYKEKLLREENLNLKLNNLEEEKKMDMEFSLNQLSVLKHELDLLLNEKLTLVKYAQQDGVIENVFVKEGEEIDAYSALMSISPVNPTAVVAYLSGKKILMPIGDSVQVKAYGVKGEVVKGKVIGFGSVVALPEILQVSTAAKAFGREMFIEIDADNALASGQKVLIQ